MTIGPLLGYGGNRVNQQVSTGAQKGQWLQINDDLETAEAAADLLKPWNISRAAFHWCRVPDWASRVLVRAKIDLAATTFTTSPVCRLVAAFPKDISPEVGFNAIRQNNGFSGTSTDDNGGCQFMRLDTVKATAAGFTLNLASAKTAMFIDSAGYIYGDPVDLVGYQTLGASLIGLMVETAANVTGGAANGVFGQALFASD